jgi:hypothetical protein
MAITSYTELQAAVANWLDRGDMAARIPEFIALAEAQMNRLLRSRGATGRSTAMIGAEFSALPPDFAQAISLRIETASDWQELSSAEQGVMSGYPPEQGVPRLYGIVGSELRLQPAPDAERIVEMTYFSKLPALSLANPSNWVLAAHPDAYLYGTLVHSAPLLRDDEILGTWRALSDAAMDQILTERRQPGGRLRTDITGARPFNITTGS